ncbi:MAG TPA: Gfo/Idh/MocA family oxidoreductase [Burkholderiales bacterium]|nr:Gfo/Idh/MocA family oxidoreductase [Burkholderiales bacterium]
MSAVNVAMVGLGWWGQNMVRWLKGNQKLNMVKLVDVNPASEKFAGEMGVPFSTDLAAVLKDPNVEAVVLATPHTLHCEQIVAAAAAKKHVFCEKPLCMNKQDVDRAIAAVKAAGVQLAVGHERRFEPGIQELFRVCQSGEIGTLLSIEGNFSQDKFLGIAADNWRLTDKEAPAGPMTATGIHILDLSCGLLGPGARAYAAVSQLGSHLKNGDTLGIMVNYKSGANALITAILATPFYGRFTVFGSLGWVEVRDKAHPETPMGWTFAKNVRGQEPVTRDYAPNNPVLANLEAFAGAVRGVAPYPVPMEQMANNVAALDAILRSVKSKQIAEIED